jgi:hypothetical protein
MYLQLKEKNNLEVWAHKTSLTPPCFIEVPVPEPSQQSERPCICVSGHRFCLFLPFFYKILELFRECGIFLFLFIYFVVFFWIIFSFLCIILYTIVCLFCHCCLLIISASGYLWLPPITSGYLPLPLVTSHYLWLPLITSITSDYLPLPLITSGYL